MSFDGADRVTAVAAAKDGLMQGRDVTPSRRVRGAALAPQTLAVQSGGAASCQRHPRSQRSRAG
jgi:hypothetical protein